MRLGSFQRRRQGRKGHGRYLPQERSKKGKTPRLRPCNFLFEALVLDNRSTMLSENKVTSSNDYYKPLCFCLGDVLLERQAISHSTNVYQALAVLAELSDAGRCSGSFRPAGVSSPARDGNQQMVTSERHTGGLYKVRL